MVIIIIIISEQCLNRGTTSFQFSIGLMYLITCWPALRLIPINERRLEVCNHPVASKVFFANETFLRSCSLHNVFTTNTGNFIFNGEPAVTLHANNHYYLACSIAFLRLPATIICLPRFDSTSILRGYLFIGFYSNQLIPRGIVSLFAKNSWKNHCLMHCIPFVLFFFITNKDVLITLLNLHFREGHRCSCKMESFADD